MMFSEEYPAEARKKYPAKDRKKYSAEAGKKLTDVIRLAILRTDIRKALTEKSSLPKPFREKNTW